MRSRICEDGQRRIMAKVEVPLDTAQITTLALAHPSFKELDDRMNAFELLNKRQLFLLAKETIFMSGSKLTIDKVEGTWSTNQINRAQQHVKTLFPEVD